MANEEDTTLTWRTRPMSKVGAALCAAFIAFIGLGLLAGTVNQGGIGDRIVGALMVACAVLGTWRFAFHPAVHLTSTDVTVINPMRTVVVPLASIGRTSAGYSGVTIDYLDHNTMRRVTAWAVQKSNIAQLLSKKRRADVLCAAIAEAVTRSSGHGVDQTPAP